MTTLYESQEAMDQEDSESTLWSKERLAKEHIIMCFRSADLEDGQFGLQWVIQALYAIKTANGYRKWTQKLWFQSTMDKKDVEPTRWDRLFRRVNTWPAHNIRLAMNVPGDVKKGFHLEYPDYVVSDCPCRLFVAVKETQKAALALPEPGPAERVINAVLEAPPDQEAAAILEAMGFDGSTPPTIPPASDAQKRKILASVSALKAGGIAVDPGDVDVMNSAQAADFIAALEPHMQQLRMQWAQQSALKGTNKL